MVHITWIIQYDSHANIFIAIVQFLNGGKIQRTRQIVRQDLVRWWSFLQKSFQSLANIEHDWSKYQDWHLLWKALEACCDWKTFFQEYDDHIFLGQQLSNRWLCNVDKLKIVRDPNSFSGYFNRKIPIHHRSTICVCLTILYGPYYMDFIIWTILDGP